MNNHSILILQLTRIGDIIQTYQSCKQAKAENPNIRFDIVVRENMGKGISFLLADVFDNVFFLNRDTFTKKDSWNEAHREISDFIQSINHNQYSCVINLSFSKTSSYLASLIQTKVKLGPRYNLKGELCIKDKWSQFVYSSVLGGKYTPFNLVDIYKRITGAKDNDTLVSENNISNRENSIVIHPFASNRKKMWGFGKWNEVIYSLLKKNEKLNVYIVGSEHDSEDAKRIIGSPVLASYKNRIHDYVEKKNIEEVHYALSKSKVFIGHDSMVSHLASTTYTPSIILSLGSVRPHETTAYGENNITLSPTSNCFPCPLADSCSHLKCHSDITHQVVSAIANEFYDGNYQFELSDLSKKIAAFHMDNVNINRTYIDEKLGQRMISLNQRASSIESTFIQFYEILWNLLLGGQDTPNVFPILENPVLAELDRYLDGINNLYELQGFASKYANQLIQESESVNPSVKKIKELSEKLNEIDNLSLSCKKPFPHLAPIVDYFYVHKSNIEADNIVDVVKHSLLIYHQASNAYAIFFELINQCLAKYAPQTQTRQEEC